jgi:hypothetical protein
MTIHRAPEFLIVGAQKAGTTSFYNGLKQHPDILPATTKEIHYFSQYFNKGLDWYLQHFPEREAGKLSGEASPFYLFHPHAAARIASQLPEVKILILLRNPVERAISHYHQQFRRHHETLAMMEAFQAEHQRIARAWQRLLDGKQASGVKVQQCSYLKRGEYLEQLLRYEQHFPPPQICLLESREFFETPQQSLGKAFEFLGVDPAFQPADLWPRKPGNYDSADPQVLAFLRDYFAPHNEALFRHLGYRFSW